MSEKSPESKERGASEKPPPADPNKVAKALGRTAIRGAGGR